MKAPIFIVGCERSGTTLLRFMLVQSPVLHIPGESWFLPQLRDQQEVYGDFTKPYQRWFFIRDLQTNKATSQTFSFSIFKLTLEEAEAALAEAAPTTYPGAASALFRASAHKHGKQRWGDKTPRHVLHISWFAEAFPNAKFVHVTRDGRDVAISLLKAGWVSSFLQAAHHWQERVEIGISAGSALGKDRYYELHYEQLVMTPEETLKNLCNWLELEYTPQMLQQHESANTQISRDWHLHEMVAKPVDSSRVQAWKQKLSRREVADFEGVAGDLLKKLGYEVSGVTLPFWLRSSRSVIGRLKPHLKKTIGILRKIEAK